MPDGPHNATGRMWPAGRSLPTPVLRYAEWYLILLDEIISWLNVRLQYWVIWSLWLLLSSYICECGTNKLFKNQVLWKASAYPSHWFSHTLLRFNKQITAFGSRSTPRRVFMLDSFHEVNVWEKSWHILNRREFLFVLLLVYTKNKQCDKN